MSFSGEVKKELSALTPKARHCQIAELAAILIFAAKIQAADGDVPGRKNEKILLSLETDNPLLEQTYAMLLTFLFGMVDDCDFLTGADAVKVLESVKMWEEHSGRIRDMTVADGLLVQQSCCKRAFIRGAFLAAGSVNNPQKAYHFEIVCGSLRLAQQIQGIMRSFDVDARIVPRKKSQVLYVKEGAHIVDLLNIMGAHKSLMSFENTRIYKDMRNSVNRRVNCEMANISKTASAAVRQMEDILFIQNNKGFESLPDNLKEIALLRLEYPDMPMKELGTYLDPPVGKSGVNHRFRRISEIAEAMGRTP